MFSLQLARQKGKASCPIALDQWLVTVKEVNLGTDRGRKEPREL